MQGWVVWITGLPGSGKSTIADFLTRRLKERRIRFQPLSIDSLRKVVTPEPTYSEWERDIVYGALVYTAYLLSKNNINVLIDATGNRRRFRDKGRSIIKRFIEVYVKCPIEICIEREKQRKGTHKAPRGIYEKGLIEESKTVPGLGSPYEEPFNPEVIIQSDREAPDKAAERILPAMKQLFKEL